MSRVHGSATDLQNTNRPETVVSCFTLIDITKTGVVSNYKPNALAFIDDADQEVDNEASWNRSRNQQRNFETIIQTIGLRSQLMFIGTPVTVEIDLADLNFGKEFSGLQKVWNFDFAVEHVDVFTRGDNQLILLEEDLNLVPCILRLTETVNIKNPIYQTLGSNKNIYVEILQ